MKILFVFLTILKILGLIIAGILALILLLAALVLFVPIRYKGEASFKGKPDVSARASYLLHILSLKFDLHNGESKLTIKIFGHALGNKKKKSKKKKNKTKNTSKKTKKEKNKNKSSNEITINEEPKDLPKLEEKPEAVTKTPTEKEGKSKTDSKEQASDYSQTSNKDKKSIFKKLKEKYNVISAKISNTIKELNDESNKRALKVLTDGISKILKHIKPQKHEVIMTFGMGDPATTGELLGIIYSISYLAGINIIVTPDFDNKIFEVSANFKGRIRIFTLGIIFLKAYKNKDFKKALHRFI